VLEAFIRQIPLFEFAASSELTELLRLLVADELRAGDLLFREGEPGNAMWILGEGTEVSVTSLTGQNRAVVVNYATKGAVIGEMALIDDAPRSGTGLVTVGGPAHRIDARDFHALRNTFSPVAFKVLRKLCIELSGRLRATNDRIVPSSNQRLETPEPPAGTEPSPEEVDAFAAFSNLPAVVKFALSQRLRQISVSEMTPLFGEGEASNGVYFIVEGEVAVGRNGKTFATLPPGTMFGQVSCIDHGRRSASCLSTGPAKLLHMSARDFESLFASGHRFAFQIIDLVARQLVQHVRAANALLPAPGRLSSAIRAEPMTAVLSSTADVADLELIRTELPFDSEAFELDDVASLDIEIDLS
jgi:CRP-like cAMP-binding protein